MSSSHIPILKSQLTPPIVNHEYVQRVKLHKQLQLITNYPLTIIYAGPGYGKTIGLSSYIKNYKGNACWLTVTDFDQDFTSFLTKLITTVKNSNFGFGDEILNMFERGHPHLSNNELWTYMALFVNEVEKLETEFIILIDDAHLLYQSHHIDKWFQILTKHLPRNLHLVISTRHKPNWSSLSHLKVQGDLLEVGPTYFTLSLDEVDHYIRDINHIEMSDDQIEEIYNLTEGWPIACSMIVQQLNGGHSYDRLISDEDYVLHDLYQYMQVEIFYKQPSIVQKFLEQTSVLDILTEEACNRLLHISSSSLMIKDLFKLNLFIRSLNDGTYCYHPLFQKFLLYQLKETSIEEFKWLHHEAAIYYEEKQDLTQAIKHYLTIRKFDVAAFLLSQHGRLMLEKSQYNTLEAYLKELPSEQKEKYSILFYFDGELNRYKAKYELAEEKYNQSIANANGNSIVLSLAYEGVARIFLDTIRPDRADYYLRKAIEYQDSVEVKGQEKARLYHMLGENLLNLGHAKKAESWLEKAIKLDSNVDETNLEARIYLRTGRLYQAKQCLLERKNNIPKQDLEHLPQSYRETDILLSIIEAFMGEAEEGKKNAEKGLQLGIEYKSLFIEACGWMRMGHSVQLIERYDADLAVQCYENALYLMEQLNISRLKAEPYMGLCVLYGTLGQYEKAVHAGQEGLRETELVKDMWLSGVIRLCLSISSIQCKRYEYALSMLDEAHSHFKTCGDDYGLMAVAFWRAFLDFELKSDQFEVNMDEFITRLQTGSYDFFLKNRTYFGPIDLQLIAPLLHKALSHDIHVPYVTRMIHELGFGNLEKHPGYTLRLKTLGEFKVTVGQEPIHDSDWSRAKSKELLELLITNRHKAITKEEIFEYLWPDQDEEGANKNFKVTLNGLLKKLEPHRKAREESFFIIRSGSSYRLNPQSGYELDVNLFERFIESGLEESDPDKAKELLLRALKLYQSDYLSNHKPVDWLVLERERLQVLFLRGAEKLAQVSVRLEDYHTCIHWCQEILSRDQTWEEAYRLLIYCYYQQNNRPQAIKWYKRCEQVLEEELNIKPMRSTHEMYEMVMELI